jgi:hypothetical protein
MQFSKSLVFAGIIALSAPVFAQSSTTNGTPGANVGATGTNETAGSSSSTSTQRVTTRLRRRARFERLVPLRRPLLPRRQTTYFGRTGLRPTVKHGAKHSRGWGRLPPMH